MAQAKASGGIPAARLVVAAGVCAALHVGKLPPAVTALQAALGLTLIEAAFLLSLVQFAGMTAGLAFGALADALGLRRSLLAGLVTLTVASALGAFSPGAPSLMVLRAAEGFGFLLVVLPAPSLVRQLVPPDRLARMIGLWGAYMPIGTALALLAGPLVIAAVGWRGWWLLLAAVTAAMALAVARGVPARLLQPRAPEAVPWLLRVRHTLGAPGPWLAALAFSMYSAQWLAVIGFLPTVYQLAGITPAAAGVLTAAVAAANIAGNVASGHWLHRGVPALRLMALGFAVMAIGTVAAYAALPLPPVLRYAAVLAFSAFGGLVPATLFALSMRIAPGEHTLSSTVGWMQQWSAFGQFCGPPLVAWLASLSGGWQFTWVATVAWSAAGLALATVLVRRCLPAERR